MDKYEAVEMRFLGKYDTAYRDAIESMRSRTTHRGCM